MVCGAGLGPHTLFFLPTSGAASPAQSGRCHRLCKPFKYMECMRNKWNCEEGDVFREGKFELLYLMETILKGNGEVSWCGVNGIISSVQMLGKVWPSC